MTFRSRPQDYGLLKRHGTEKTAGRLVGFRMFREVEGGENDFYGCLGDFCLSFDELFFWGGKIWRSCVG